jgi:hypothetical protein
MTSSDFSDEILTCCGDVYVPPGGEKIGAGGGKTMS